MDPDRYRSKWPRAYSHRAKVEAKAKKYQNPVKSGRIQTSSCGLVLLPLRCKPVGTMVTFNGMDSLPYSQHIPGTYLLTHCP